MRINLTKKDLVNLVYMQLGFSKQISLNLIEDFFSILILEIIVDKKSSIRLSEICFEKPSCI